LSAYLSRIRQETLEQFTDGWKMISEMQAKFLYQLVKIKRPKRILEIGTFTGYSTMVMVEAMPSDCSLTSVEADAGSATIALGNLSKYAGSRQAEVVHEKGLDHLAKSSTAYDFIFIDAEKKGYTKYFDSIVQNNLLTEDGLMLFDNSKCRLPP
jgi:predicted O-methyltransferase YrrM